MTKLQEMGQAAKQAAARLAVLGAAKSHALLLAAQALLDCREEILSANAKDLTSAAENGMSKSMQDRLRLDETRIADMAKGMREVAAEKDPVGLVLDGETRPNGLSIARVTVPLGVIGIIFEARPNVTSDAAALCIQAGNAVILRGGKEAIHSNTAVVRILQQALENAGLPRESLQLVTDTSRASATELMGLTDYLDVLIPRGGAGLIRSVKENSRVPVIETGVGNCHIYVDKTADILQAAEIVFNAKTSRPSVCNAAETLLVHEAVAKEALPVIKARLAEKQVEIRGCEKTRIILPGCVSATEADYETEFLDYILAVRVVSSLQEAVAHIQKYSSRHSEAILTRDTASAEEFLNTVDSAAVYVNASTRFTDGGVFGLGAEIGISTQKLHARGPMGVRQLTSYKYIIRGNGQIR